MKGVGLSLFCIQQTVYEGSRTLSLSLALNRLFMKGVGLSLSFALNRLFMKGVGLSLFCTQQTVYVRSRTLTLCLLLKIFFPSPSDLLCLRSYIQNCLHFDLKLIIIIMVYL